jgi:hypothetical protein
MRALYAILLVAAMMGAALAAPARPTAHKPKHATAALPPGKRRPASRGEALQLEKAGHAGNVKVRRVMVTRMVHGRLVRVSRIMRVHAEPVTPPHPEPERLREIQKALAEKGYFKGEASGEWNGDSVEALKKFQTARNLPPDGKINALSLIGLGLGPKHEGNVAQATPPLKTAEVPPR